MKYLKNWFDAKKIFGLILCLIFVFVYNVTSPPSSSLPQALPNVSVDASGKANLNIPISVPIGGPLVPNLILSYNSDAQNSFMGKGWTISGFESVYMNITDNANLPDFSSSITGVLVDISGNKTEYRAKNEIYAKVVPSNPADCGSGPCAWTIFTKDGIRYKFGSSANSRITVRGKPDVKQWLVDRVEDVNGNGYNISYIIDNNAGFYYPNTITYIDRVIQFNLATRSDQNQEYASNVGNGMNQIVTGISITAAGETYRNYTFNYTQGVDKVSLLNKISQTGYKDIDISHSNKANTIQPVAGVPANTNLDYRVPFFNQGKCQEVKDYCTCAAVSACWEPILSASYGLIDPREECATGAASLGDLCKNGMQTGPVSIMGDVTGDGKADIIKIVGGQDDNHIQVLRLNEAGGTESSLSPQIKLRINSYISVADIDGNGRLEVLYAEDNNQPLKVAYYDLSTNSFSDIRPVSNITVDTLGYDPNNLNLVSRNFTSDINGDKKTDFVSIYDEGANTRLRIFVSNGSGFQGGYDIVTPNLGTDNTQRFFMDTNGDGRPEWVQMQNDNPKEMKVSTLDLVAKTSNYITYSFDLSAGTAKITNFKNISFPDVNGDGKIDLSAVLNDGTVSVALFTENGFTPAQFSSLPNVAPQYLAMGDNAFQETQNTVAFSDVNGDGKDDLVYSKNGTLYISYSNGKGYNVHNDTKSLNGAFQLADITGNGKADIIGMELKEKPKTPIFQIQAFRIDSDTPVEYTGSATLVVQATNKEHKDLIQTVANNDGQTVNVSYTLNKDLPGVVTPNNGSYPNLPDLSAEHLVTTVVTDPGGGLPATKETYEHGNKRYYAGTNDTAGSLGFKSVTKTISLLTTNGEEVTTKIVTDCDQTNPIAFNSPVQTKIYNGSGGLQQVYSYQYEVGTTANGTKEYREKIVSNSIYENNQYLLNNTETKYYDGFGNLNRAVSNTEGKVKETIRTFGYDVANWILVQPLTSTTTIDTVITNNEKYAFSGLNLLSYSTEIEPGKWATTSSTYDSIGNMLSQTSPLGKTDSYSYDTYSNNTSLKDSNGSEVRVEVNPATGAIVKDININGESTEYKQDEYGRDVEKKNPGSSSWSEQFIYSNDPNDNYTEKRINTSMQNSFFPFIPIGLQGSDTYSWTREYTNSIGNKTKMQASEDGVKIYQMDFEYDLKGNLTRKSNVYLLGVETPIYKTYQYGINDRITSIANANGESTAYSMSNLVYKKELGGNRTIITKKDVSGKEIEKTIGNLKYNYEYYPDGKLKRITDPASGNTEFTYDRVGKMLSQTNANTGKKIMTYDLEGKMLSFKDARGVTNQFEYDSASRLSKVSNESETIEYKYEEPGANTKGRLTSIKDNSGLTKYFYDKVGNIIKTIRKFDDYTIQFQNVFDSKNRLIQKIYPDGTIATYTYAMDGLANIKVKTSDGKLDNQTLIEYNRDKANGTLTKKFGNGVVSNFDFNLLSGKMTGMKTTTSRNSVEQQKEYKYDINNNISELLDLVNPAKNQTFEYDVYNRLTKAKGKYGEEAYVYTDNGNLTQKGDIELSYADTNKPHAVTKIKKPQETINLEYDSVGNLIKKNNDKYIHDALGRLSSIQTSDGQEFQYIYNHKGRRVKKINRLKTEVTYYFEDGLYEIQKVPGKSDEHTLYFKDENSAVAQWTRTDAVLPNIDLSAVPPVPSPFLTQIEENYNDLAYRIDKVLTQSPNSAYLFLLLIPIVFYLVEKRTLVGYTLSISIVSLVFITCIGTKKKQFPFAALMMASGINSETPGIGNNGDTSSNSNSGNGQVSGGSSAGTPVAGFYFLHRDYLDSVTMVTDGKGEMVSGMDLATGKSVVDYKPYGEIDRKNSDGPDIFRYKYTGQEEDRETGLYYYKSRYYDPEIGRFLEPDTYLNSKALFGMNQYMYVLGNPVKYNDPSGHKWKLSHITKGHWGKQFKKFWHGQTTLRKRVIHMWNQHLPKNTMSDGQRSAWRGYNLCMYVLSQGRACMGAVPAQNTSNSGDPDPGENPEPPTQEEPECDDCHFPTLTYDGEEIDETGDGFVGNYIAHPFVFNPDRTDPDFAGLYPDNNYTFEDDYSVIPQMYWFTDRYGDLIKPVIVRYFRPNEYPNDICNLGGTGGWCSAPGMDLDIPSKWQGWWKEYTRKFTYYVYTHAFDNLDHPGSHSIILGRRAPIPYKDKFNWDRYGGYWDVNF